MKNKKVIFWIAVMVISGGIIVLSFLISREKKEVETARESAAALKQEAQSEGLVFFQEEVLTKIFTEAIVGRIKEDFTNEILLNGDPGTSCCVVLSNTAKLSDSTWRIFLQTNEAENNLYQVLVNVAADMIDISEYDRDIPGIEEAGGVTYGDNIERIYIYHIEDKYYGK